MWKPEAGCTPRQEFLSLVCKSVGFSLCYTKPSSLAFGRSRFKTSLGIESSSLPASCVPRVLRWFPERRILERREELPPEFQLKVELTGGVSIFCWQTPRVVSFQNRTHSPRRQQERRADPHAEGCVPLLERTWGGGRGGGGGRGTALSL